MGSGYPSRPAIPSPTWVATTVAVHVESKAFRWLLSFADSLFSCAASSQTPSWTLTVDHA